MATRMQAPQDFVSATIEGHEYERDDVKDGVLVVKNGNHVRTLVRHGFTVLAAEAVPVPQEPKPEEPAKTDETKTGDNEKPIDKMTVPELKTFIEERGGDVPDDAKKDDLQRIAKSLVEEED